MYSLEKFTFKTKKEMQDYVRSVVYSLGESVIKPDSPHFTLFKDIIKKENIIEFHIVKNPINKKAFHMMYKLKNGSMIDFSWLKCGLDSVDNSLIKAMRNEIYEDIINFKKHCEKKCVFCNVTDSEFHVDHHEPSFKQLSDSFLEDKNIEDYCDELSVLLDITPNFCKSLYNEIPLNELLNRQMNINIYY